MDNSKRPLNPDFSLNQPRYQGAQILLTRKNFGCGSSREHAPWALDDYGFRAVIAPSLCRHLLNNCYKNGLLPIVLTEEQVDQLFKEVEANEGYQLSIDLAEQTLTTPSGETFKFDITEHRKHCLLNGLDEIGLTLQHADEIHAFRRKNAAKASLGCLTVDITMRSSENECSEFQTTSFINTQSDRYSLPSYLKNIPNNFTHTTP